MGACPGLCGGCPDGGSLWEVPGAEELTKEMARAFIRKIVCYGNDRFEVEYTFEEELAALVEVVN